MKMVRGPKDIVKELKFVKINVVHTGETVTAKVVLTQTRYLRQFLRLGN